MKKKSEFFNLKWSNDIIEHKKWLEIIPPLTKFRFKEYWDIDILFPYPDSIIKFMITNTKNNKYIILNLKVKYHSSLNLNIWVWEIYPYHNTTVECQSPTPDELSKIIKESLDDNSNNHMARNMDKEYDGPYLLRMNFSNGDESLNWDDYVGNKIFRYSDSESLNNHTNTGLYKYNAINSGLFKYYDGDHYSYSLYAVFYDLDTAKDWANEYIDKLIDGIDVEEGITDIGSFDYLSELKPLINNERIESLSELKQSINENEEYQNYIGYNDIIDFYKIFWRNM